MSSLSLSLFCDLYGGRRRWLKHVWAIGSLAIIMEGERTSTCEWLSVWVWVHVCNNFHAARVCNIMHTATVHDNNIITLAYMCVFVGLGKGSLEILKCMFLVPPTGTRLLPVTNRSSLCCCSRLKLFTISQKFLKKVDAISCTTC